jgi:hypothetical protein
MSKTIIKDPLFGDFFISKDQYCYTVFENYHTDTSHFKSKGVSKQHQNPIGYFKTLSGAVECVFKSKLHNDGKEYESFKDYMNDWKILKEEINNLLNKITL